MYVLHFEAVKNVEECFKTPNKQWHDVFDDNKKKENVFGVS